jgi:hypothetical protein
VRAIWLLEPLADRIALSGPKFGQESLLIPPGQVIGALIVLAGFGAAVQAADNHHASAKRATSFLARAADAPAKGGSHAKALRLQLAQDVPAHGEQDGLRSMQVWVQQEHRSSLRGDLVNDL